MIKGDNNTTDGRREMRTPGLLPLGGHTGLAGTYSRVNHNVKEVPEEQREEAVNSLVFEAEVRLQDPIYGCIGAIAMLQRKMVELQHDLAMARARLACCTAKPSPVLLDNHVDTASSLCDLLVNNGMVASFSQNFLELNQSG
ncbi:hypothetical protein F0562_031559 [Nyssa sinensis]|uniref:LOB domain-containing protein n=1 Tax=Nyssa sinensis TaxID=561372 RepID=A0A5J5AW92_9ASTE|nr:hypothetical protein F0562_031559 [Nyssa sinensis]